MIAFALKSSAVICCCNAAFTLRCGCTMNIMDFILNLSSVAVHFTSLLLLVFLVQTSAAGPFQVIGSALPIVVAPGDDIILPCHVEPPFDVVDLTVEWSKPDLRTEPNDRLRRAKYVHLYRDNREVPDMKMLSYIRRTSLFVDDLKQGNISLSHQCDAGR